MHSQGGETSIQDSYSRWGVKGSSEVSEGLTAIYRYEEGLDLATTTLSDNNRLSYVGLSGGFGTVTMGRIWSAAYNHLGALTDTGIHNAPNQSTGTRTSNALSYSASTGPVSFQIDANMIDTNMNEKEESKRSVDMAQLGVSFDTGAAKIGLAFKTSKTKLDSTRMSGIGLSIPVGGLNLYSSWSEKKVTTFKRDSAGDGIVIPVQERIEIAAQTGGEVGGQEGVEPVPETPDRCLIVRYSGAKFGQEAVLHPTSNLPLFWRTELTGGETRPKWDQDQHLDMTTTNRQEAAGEPVIRENRNDIVRHPDLKGDSPTTGDDILLVRYAVDVLKENEDYKNWMNNPERGGTFNTDKGVYENPISAPPKFKCPESTLLGPVNEPTGIAYRVYQSAVQEVKEVQAKDPITITGQSAGVIEGHEQIVVKKESYPAHTGGSVTTRHMHAGVSGPLGDTGMSFAINVANHPDSKDGIGENPWNFNVSKSLGGGASLAFEYVDYDEKYDNEALLRLKVDF